MNMPEKQILQVLLKSKKKIGENHTFFKDKLNWSTIFVKSLKIQSNVGRSFPNNIEAWLSLKNAQLRPIFFLDTEGTC